MADEKRVTSFRLSEATRGRLDALAERWHVDRTKILEHAVGLLADPEIGAACGDAYMAAEQALRCWAAILECAAKDNAATFDRQEWNYLADVNNGCSPMMTLIGDELRMSATMLWANAADGQRLNRAGDRWFGAKKADERVKALVEKLRGLDFAHGWAAVAAVQYFWAHTEPGAIDHEKDEWWTVEFRRGKSWAT